MLKKMYKKIIGIDNLSAFILAGLVSCLIIYFSYQFLPETLNKWNGEICDTAINDISFKRRVSNIYFLLIVAFPILVFFFKNLLFKINFGFNLILDGYSFCTKITAYVVPLLIASLLFPFKILARNNNINIKSFLLNGILFNIKFWLCVALFFAFILIVGFFINKLSIKFKGLLSEHQVEISIINIVSILYSIILLVNNLFFRDNNAVECFYLDKFKPFVIVLIMLYFLCYFIKFFYTEDSLIDISFTKFVILYISLIITINLCVRNILISVFLSAVIVIFINALYVKKYLEIFSLITISALLIPIVYFLIVQLCYVFRNYYVFYISMNKIIISSFAFGILLSFIFLKNITDGILYAMSIIMLALMKYVNFDYKILFDYLDYANVFELGNNTVAFDTLSENVFPILGYFPAHALYDVWTQLLYCFINNDKMGLFANPYGFINSVLGVIVLYNVISIFIEKKYSILIMILFPLNIVGFKIESFSLISILLLYYIFQHQKITSYILFWIITGINAFYIYDAGMTLGMASIVVYIIYLVVNRDFKSMRNFIIVGIIIGLLVGIFSYIYLSFIGVNFIDRVLEWKSLTLNSFCVLAHVNMGKYFSLSYLFVYFALPAFAVLTILYLLFYKIQYLNFIGYFALVFAFSQILYVSRGVAFHNLAVCRGITGVLMNYAPWTICLFLLFVFNVKFSQENNNYNAFLFMISFTMCILISILITRKIPDSNTNLYINAFNNSNKVIEDVDINYNNKRIISTEDTKSFYGGFEDVFNLLLNDNESFIDFADITSVYAYTNRKRPCYVSQSPGLLSDLFSQNQFINEIKKINVPLAVLGNSWTNYISQIYDMHHNIRYYNLAEYIYSNYKPLVLIHGDFAIWCLKERYNEYKSLLLNSQYTQSLIDYGYDKNNIVNGNVSYNILHNYTINDLPYIEANKNNLNRIYVNEIDYTAFDSNTFKLNNIDMDINKSYYIKLWITSNDNEKTSIVINNNDNVVDGYKYNFNLRKGMNSYIFRISEDYFWYNKNMNAVQKGDDKSYIINKISLLSEKK